MIEIKKLRLSWEARGGFVKELFVGTLAGFLSTPFGWFAYYAIAKAVGFGPPACKGAFPGNPYFDSIGSLCNLIGVIFASFFFPIVYVYFYRAGVKNVLESIVKRVLLILFSVCLFLGAAFYLLCTFFIFLSLPHLTLSEAMHSLSVSLFIILLLLVPALLASALAVGVGRISVKRS